VSAPDGRLVLGPLLRYVDDTSAAVWVETGCAATVEVTRGSVSTVARTFAVHGHHYALVELSGLAPGTTEPYTVAVDGEQVWPETGSPFPAPVIATLDPVRPLRMAFGSCRTSVSHDEKGNRTHGVDALRAWALRMADQVAPADPDDPDLAPTLPDLILFLGDQVYADETTEEMREFIESRRDIEQPPWTELKDYEEYAHLYGLAWSDPANRWLLSTVPSSMIFDDHDVRDDWNTSLEWRREMEGTSWWHGRIVAGLASYWVHQHLGNLSPAERAADEIWSQVLAHPADAAELDLGPVLDAFADRVDQHPETYRWSYVRDLGPRVRLVVVDSRAARRLDTAERAMLDPGEAAWFDAQLRGDVDHLLIGTSLPFLLARGLHHLEAFSEALAQGAWGRVGSRVGERLRQAVDLEHWGAFQNSFQPVARQVLEVAAGERGAAPASVTFLSGDVHHSYVSEAWPVDGRPLGSMLLQAVCSPIRNPLSRNMRFATAVLSYGVAGPVGRLASRSTRVPDAPLSWRYAEGPWFDNNLACLHVAGRGLRMWWMTGEVVDDHERPRLAKVASYELDEEGRPPGRTGFAARAARRVRSRVRRR
jgi:phosphodiesterase/alkaline phosphatase D-like protein